MLAATGKSEFGWYGVAGGMATIALAAFEMKLKRVGLLNSITYCFIELRVKKVSGQYEK